MAAAPRQDNLGWFGQVAIEQFALDLQADQQEEQRHQAIVDPQQGRLGDFQRANLRHHRYIQKRGVQV